MPVLDLVRRIKNKTTVLFTSIVAASNITCAYVINIALGHVIGELPRTIFFPVLTIALILFVGLMDTFQPFLIFAQPAIEIRIYLLLLILLLLLLLYLLLQ